ncbi:MAG: type II CAAX prenyl endopeptidase Rce1 family protein, partial [Bacillota bacterium]
VALSTLPQLVQGKPGLPPFWVVAGASVAQSALLLALSVWAGVRLAPRLGLHAPALQAWIERSPAWPHLRAALPAALGAGVLAGAGLVLAAASAPAELAALRARVDVALPWRMLYGGITEELLLRWGMMSVLAWLFWRFLQGGAGVPGAAWMWSAIVVSALLFGAGHLPAAAAQAGALGPALVAHVVLVNAAFGLLAGWLFWRHGLEAAMMAHACAHLVAYLLGS